MHDSRHPRFSTHSLQHFHKELGRFPSNVHKHYAAAMDIRKPNELGYDFIAKPAYAGLIAAPAALLGATLEEYGIPLVGIEENPGPSTENGIVTNVYPLTYADLADYAEEARPGSNAIFNRYNVGPITLRLPPNLTKVQQVRYAIDHADDLFTLRQNAPVDEVAEPVPPPPLVGVELNPGPPRKGKKKKQKPRKTSMPRMKSAPVSMFRSPAASYSFQGLVVKGRNVLRITGRQRLIDAVSTVTTGLVVFGNVASGGTNNTGSIGALPTNFGDPIKSIALQFAGYKWKKLVFDYSPEQSTNTTGQICLGFWPDGYITTGTYSRAQITTIENSFETAPWKPASLNATRVVASDDHEYDMYLSATTPADYRSAVAGNLLIGGTTSVVTSGTILGAIWVSYTLDLCNMGSDATFGISHTPEEIERVREHKMRLMFGTNDGKEESADPGAQFSPSVSRLPLRR